MKRILAILTSLLIVTGLKAQKVNAQKETVKPKAGTLVKEKVPNQLNNIKSQKGVKVTPALKYTPAVKVSTASTKAIKKLSVHQ